MADFDQITQQNFANRDRFKNQGRVSQRDVLPQAIKSRLVSQDIIVKTSEDSVAGSVADGASLIVVSVIGFNKPGIKLGVVPYNFAAFYDNTSIANLIGNGTGANFIVTGPFSLPGSYAENVSSIFPRNTENQIVYITEIHNASGSPYTITAITNTIVLVPAGKDVA